ncbi:MAG: PfkB family carbohydrate kinase [Planctomycetia bacterium]|nr:PfkB family carbohydrate kinase [Planctomycetia bacterium]
MIALERLAELVAAFPRLTIGLVGDLFLDRYLHLEPGWHELSIETGLEAYQITSVRNSPGALGTVMNNLAALGVGRLVPTTVVGDDGASYDLLKELNKLPVEVSHIVRDAERLTPTYTKPLRRDEQGTWRELNRLDLRNNRPLSPASEERLLAELEQVFRTTDGLIVLDQVNEEGWGVINPRVRERLKELAARHPDKLMFIDSRRHIDRFTAGVLKPNRVECLHAMGLPTPAEGAPIPRAILDDAARGLAQRTGRPLFCTMSEEGILVVRPDGEAMRVPSFPVSGPIDIVGAGDSATAGIVASLLSGATPVEAAAVGNLVASITIQQLGATGTATPEQLLARGAEATRLTAPAQ